MTDEENSEKLEYTSISELLWSWPLFDNVFLSMQGQNVMLVDFYLRDLEDDLLSEYVERERSPVQSAMFVSAISQMWIFAVYELLRTWRQLVKELRSGGTVSPSKSRDQRSLPNISEDMREHHRTKYANDAVFREEVKLASKLIDPLYRRIDALRINLAKHEIKGIRGSVAPAPGYGRIDMTNGSIYWMVDLGDNAVDIVSRRTIADELRSIVLEVAN
jgi:hypothetical protein